MKYVLCIAAILLATGCATTTSTTSTKPLPGSEDVRIITHEAATSLKCKHLGGIRSLKTAGEGGMPAAHLDARNWVVQARGNALAITSQSSTPQGGGEITGDGYACASF